jgi:hypothetical protein
VNKIRCRFKQGILLISICTIFIGKAYGQDPAVSLGKTSISLNETFTITLTLPKSKKKEFHSYPYYVFPQIEDMVKKQTEYLQDPTTKEYKIVQFYAPRKAGTFTLDPFVLSFNGLPLAIKGAKIKVTAADPTLKSPEPFEEKGTEFKPEKEDVFFKILVNKTSVYINEGISVSVALQYGSPSPNLDLTFINLNEQVATIAKKIKPANCWIEEKDFSEHMRVDTFMINNKKYFNWNIYEAIFFPLDTNKVIIPSLDFKLIKYQTTLNSATTSILRKAIELHLRTPLLKIKVKNLPPHPLRNEASAGSYQLEESISSFNLKTGKSFKYNFTVIGEGNISTIANPTIKENEFFELYSPEITEGLVRNKQYFARTRTYSYYILPKEPGNFKLGDYIYWVYFDPQRNTYDTLSSSYLLKIKGESQKNSYISSTDLGSFYNTISKENNQLALLEKDEFIKHFANFIILFMLVTTAILILKK